MGYVRDLFTATRASGNPVYHERGIALLRDWIHDNPRRHPASAWAWNDHATAIRAIVLTCTADVTSLTPWLRAALDVHGRTLAEPAFYRGEGNHSLQQDLALLEVGRVRHRRDWMDLAGRRINALVKSSIDTEGVTNEQAVKYELFNYRRYRHARDRMIAVGLAPSAVFARVDRMPAVLAQATLPNGTYEMIGDTMPEPVVRFAGTDTDYAGSRGTSGSKPQRTIAWFKAGFLFARSGWGEHRAPTDETFLSVRWGPAPRFHGHADGTALTVAAWGARLLIDPGGFSYTPGAVRSFFKGRTAHNVVTVDGLAWSTRAATTLVSRHETARAVDLTLRTAGYAGIAQTRRITWSRGLDVILVDDRVESRTSHTVRQLWHFVENSAPRVDRTTVRTQRDRSNVTIHQLVGGPTIRLVSGSTRPVQGWISYHYGRKVAAPVEEAVQRGASVRYLTLIVPSSGRRVAKVSDLHLSATGYSLIVTIGTQAERITATPSRVVVESLP
jgi:hypothetical protein